VELVEEMGWDDWAISMGMIPSESKSDERATEIPVIM
jgi:hypothetical protein